MAIQKITSGILADGAIVAADIANGSITTAKIADGNVTSAKIDTVANTKITGLVTASQIANVANTQVTGSIEATQVGTTVSQLFGMRNRIINGAMEIDQRNAGASVTPVTNQYLVDRFITQLSQASKFSAQQVSANANTTEGFQQSLRVTSSSSYSVLTGDFFTIQQRIEGYNIDDFAWGTANAKTVTLSFWIYSSLTGTFGGAINNADNTRAYPFSYTISSANTWTKISITIAGDTSGTWNTTNGIGLNVYWGLGVGSTYSGTAGSWSGTTYLSSTGATSVVGTSGATWYITGVQLEVGTTATPFERRLYNQELANCQRYYEKSYELVTVPGTNAFIGMVHVSAASNGFADMLIMLNFNVQKRATPTMTFYREDGTSGSWNMERSGSSTTPTVNSGSVGDNGGRIYCATGANWTVASLKGHWVSSAEL